MKRWDRAPDHSPECTLDDVRSNQYQRLMPRVGDRLGRYLLLRRLAGGGMGEVYVAARSSQRGLGPYVALKILRDELACDRQFVDMLTDEANICMFLRHHNVVSVLELAEEKGTHFWRWSSSRA